MEVNFVKYAISAYFTGFEKTDWSGSGRSLRLCSELAKRDERPNPSLSAIKVLNTAIIDVGKLCKICHWRIFYGI